MTFQFTAGALLAAVADIRRLAQFGTLGWLKVRAGFKTLGLIAGMARLSIGKFAGLAQITVVLAILSDHARIISSGLFAFDMVTDLLGNGCWILHQLCGNSRKAFSLSETDFNGNPVAES